MDGHDPTPLFGAVVGLAVLLGQILATAVKAILPRPREEQRSSTRAADGEISVRAELEELRGELARGLRALREDLEHDRRRRARAEETKP